MGLLDSQAKIIVTANVQQAQAEFKKLKGELGEFNAQTQAVGKGAQAWQDAAIAMGILTTAVVAGKAAFDATVGATIKYGEEVEKMSRLIGATSQQSSRLIAVTNMLGMSSDTVSVAMTQAIKKGYRPTIDGLAEMADKYNSIQDPIARTKYLLDTFGRSGAQMGELMDRGAAGIKALGIEADKTGTIMSDQDVKAAKALSIELNTLKLHAEGVGISIGTYAIPSLNAMFDSIKTGMSYNDLAKFYAINSAIDAGAIAAGNAAQEVGFLKNTIDGVKSRDATVTITANGRMTGNKAVLDFFFGGGAGSFGQSGGGFSISEKMAANATANDYQADSATRAAIAAKAPITDKGTRGTQKAAGGQLNGWTLVGEAGEELISPGGHVYSAAETKRLRAMGIGAGTHRALDPGTGGFNPGSYVNTGAIGGLSLNNGDSITQRLMRSGGGGGGGAGAAGGGDSGIVLGSSLSGTQLADISTRTTQQATQAIMSSNANVVAMLAQTNRLLATRATDTGVALAVRDVQASGGVSA